MKLESNYINTLPFNNGIRVNGPGPLDDRSVAKSVESLYITVGHEERCPIFGRAYFGMKVSVLDETDDATLYILKDPEPYMRGHVSNVDSTNIKDYWTIIYSNSSKSDTETRYINIGTFDSSSADSTKMLTSHGNLAKGMTIGNLKGMTLSQILEKILFETAVPQLVDTSTASISFKNYDSTVDVGKILPSQSYMTYSYTPDRYQWVSASDSTIKGDKISLSKFKSITYYRNTALSHSGTGNAEVPITEERAAVEGTNGYYYGYITFEAGNDAVDSMGSTTMSSGEKYAEAYGGTMYTSYITVTGAWRAYHNATNVYTSSLKSTAYNALKDLTSGTINNDEKTQSVFITGKTVLYANWPLVIKSGDGTILNTLHFYVPDKYNITSVKYANDFQTNVYDTDANFECISTNVSISNNMKTIGSFRDYTIEPASGATGVEITIEKIKTE